MFNLRILKVVLKSVRRIGFADEVQSDYICKLFNQSCSNLLKPPPSSLNIIHVGQSQQKCSYSLGLKLSAAVRCKIKINK